jgi:hypothetical protein
MKYAVSQEYLTNVYSLRVHATLDVWRIEGGVGIGPVKEDG